MVEQDDDETGLIRASIEGDHEAFSTLVRRYQRMIHSLTFRFTGSMSQAEDLAQEAFIHAYQQLDSFRGQSKFSSWLCRIAVNLSLNWKKRDQRRETIHLEWSQDQSFREESALDADALSGEIQHALLKLKPKQRAAIVLTVFEGLNHAEAAKVLGCSETTVSWRVFAARQQLKLSLKHLGKGGAP